MPTPPRRWFAFRLRTLLVVVAVCAAVAWTITSLEWIRQRRLLMDAEASFGQWYETGGDIDGTGMLPPVSVPWQLAIFGEKPAWYVWLNPNLHEADFQEACRLFPEAEIGFFYLNSSIHGGVRMDESRQYRLRAADAEPIGEDEGKFPFRKPIP